MILQVHYHPSGKPEVDRSRIGLYFCAQAGQADPPLDQRRQPRRSGSRRASPNVEVKATWHVPVDVEALAVTPHMHLLGSDMRMTVTFPDGRTQDLIKIDDWDPDWQNTYYFEKPIALPKGSVVKVVAHFDNSADNPRNPNQPPKLVTWGEATTDEMCVGFIGVIKKGQDLTRPGEKDDLFEILMKQYHRKVMSEEAARKRR